MSGTGTCVAMQDGVHRTFLSEWYFSADKNDEELLSGQSGKELV
jgi:hypothetical protein